jgi:uncharacterized protein
VIEKHPLKLGSAGMIGVLVLGSACGACLAGGREDAAAKPAPQSAQERGARRAEVRLPNDHVVVAEIADTPELQAKGYMFRREVGAGEGMVFLFAEPDIHPFWMKNTLVPLDIIWMDEARTIVHIEANTPPCKSDPCPTYGPMRKTSTVLEVRAGAAAAEGLKIGQKLRITIPQSGD